MSNMSARKSVVPATQDTAPLLERIEEAEADNVRDADNLFKCEVY